MNTWITLLSLVTLTSAALDQEFVDEFLERIQEVGTICAEETHATTDDIAELIARKIPPSTHEGKCMIFCVQKHLKMMKADGGIDRMGAMLVIKPIQKQDPDLYQKILKIYIACGMKIKLSEDPCQSASDLAECGKDEAEALDLDDTIFG